MNSCWVPSLLSKGSVNASKMLALGFAVVKNPPAKAGNMRLGFHPWVRKIPLEEGMATHPNVLAWRIPWTEEPGGLWSIGSERVGHR